MKIDKMIIKYNKTAKRGRTIKYIVIHDTGNPGKGSGVDNHFRYFNGGKRNASADFFVDDKKIGQFTNYKDEYSWHVGDGKGKYGITNENSLGIEICINSDGNYEKACNNAIELTKKLMKELNIPADRVVRHYDASRKSCPNSMKSNSWQKWKEFKKKLTSTSTNTTTTKTNFVVGSLQKNVTVTSDLNCRSGRGSEYKILATFKEGTKVNVWYVDKAKDGSLWGSCSSGVKGSDGKVITGYIHMGYVK